MLSQWGAMGRQDLTLVPLAKVTAFSSGLSNPLQVILHTHTQACIHFSLVIGEISSSAVQWDESLMSPIHSQNNK